MNSNFDIVWMRITRVASFFLGIGIGAYETVVDKSDRPYLLAFAAGLIGLPLARAIDAGLSKLGSAAPTELPRKDPKKP